jgi:rhodanese-related sulfurtransferase
MPPPIPVDEAAQKWSHGAFVLDVRTAEEWEQGHIPDSVAIPLVELPDRLSEIPRDREIVVVCSLGERSQEGLEILVDAGFEKATCMSGGITRWQARGYPIETGP